MNIMLISNISLILIVAGLIPAVTTRLLDILFANTDNISDRSFAAMVVITAILMEFAVIPQLVQLLF